MVVAQIDDSHILLKIDGQLYSSEVIHKCFYWYGNDFSVDIKSEQDIFWINLTSLRKVWDSEGIINKIKTDLIDFKTREIITKETKNIREILIAKAFANSDDFDELPLGNVNDPLGFDPSKI